MSEKQSTKVTAKVRLITPTATKAGIAKTKNKSDKKILERTVVKNMNSKKTSKDAVSKKTSRIKKPVITKKEKVPKGTPSHKATPGAAQQTPIDLQEMKKQTPTLCLTAVTQDGNQLEYVQQKTPELCKAAVTSCGDALRFVPEKLMSQELCDIAVKQNGWSLQYVPEKFQTAELCDIAVARSVWAFEYVPDSYKSAELCAKAVQKKGDALEYVPEEFKTQDLCLVALKDSPGSVFAFVPDKFKTKALCARAIADGASLQFVPEKFKTPEFCEIAVLRRFSNRRYLPSALKPAYPIEITIGRHGIQVCGADCDEETLAEVRNAFESSDEAALFSFADDGNYYVYAPSDFNIEVNGESLEDPLMFYGKGISADVIRIEQEIGPWEGAAARLLHRSYVSGYTLCVECPFPLSMGELFFVIRRVKGIQDTSGTAIEVDSNNFPFEYLAEIRYVTHRTLGKLVKLYKKTYGKDISKFTYREQIQKMVAAVKSYDDFAESLDKSCINLKREANVDDSGSSGADYWLIEDGRVTATTSGFRRRR